VPPEPLQYDCDIDTDFAQMGNGGMLTEMTCTRRWF
jgi:hypothetical protein